MYAHNREHDFSINLGDDIELEEEAYDRLIETIPVHGWNYDQEELDQLIEDEEIYFSNSPIH